LRLLATGAMPATAAPAYATTAEVGSSGNEDAAGGRTAPPRGSLNALVLGTSAAGKSTLIGHLVCKRGCAEASVLKQLECNATPAGSEHCDFALVVDRPRRGCEAPCADGDAQKWHVDVGDYRLVVSEMAGDRRHLKDVAAEGFEPHSGSVDVALVVVSAAPGELEKGLSADGQTREHALLARVIGAGHVVVCVTKMDEAAEPYSEARFEEAAGLMRKLLRKVGFAGDAPCIPMSGRAGDNVVQCSQKMAWYGGPTLVAALDAIPAPAPPAAAPLRVVVREVYYIDSVGAVAAGRVEQGTLRFGQQVVFAPGGATGKVRSVEVDRETVREAHARDLVSFAVEGLDAGDLQRGMVVSEAADPLVASEAFTAQVAVLRGPADVKAGFSVVLACHAATVPCQVEEILSLLDKRTGDVRQDKPAVLKAGDVGLVRFRPLSQLCVEAFGDSPGLGPCPSLSRFATPREQVAVALVGVIREVHGVSPKAEAAGPAQAVTPAAAEAGTAAAGEAGQGKSSPVPAAPQVDEDGTSCVPAAPDTAPGATLGKSEEEEDEEDDDEGGGIIGGS